MQMTRSCSEILGAANLFGGIASQRSLTVLISKNATNNPRHQTMVAAAQRSPRLAILELRIAMGLELIQEPSAFAMASNGSARSKLAQPPRILLCIRVVLRVVEILTMATTRLVLLRCHMVALVRSRTTLSAFMELRNGKYSYRSNSDSSLYPCRIHWPSGVLLVIHSCGECCSSSNSRCDSGWWLSQVTDACMRPSCMFDKTSWPELAGMTCVEASTEIFKVYPGMTVVCLKDTDPMPEADDFNRYLALTDANGIVINVFFNNNNV